MALTAVAVARSTLNAAGFSTASLQVPRQLVTSAVAIDTNHAKGVALTQAANQGPAAIVTFTGDAAWYWSDTDELTAANMQLVPTGVPYAVQCTPGKTQNFYMKTATTANIAVTMIA